MKVLRLYNHMGLLELEFKVYVDGIDFKWEADKPVAIWFGKLELVNVDGNYVIKICVPGEESKASEPTLTELVLLESVVDEKLIKEVNTFVKEESKNEPKKPNHKSRRNKRTSSPNALNSPTVISQENPGEDTTS